MFGVISNIQRFTVHDGPGIRLTVFLQGCPLDCWWCHNPENIPECHLNGVKEVYKYSPDELMNEIRKDLIFMDESGGGVTFSGGEPFMQTDFLVEILKRCHEDNIHTCLDTSAYTEESELLKTIPYTDTYLFDIKLMDDEQHQKYTGVSNRSILKNLKKLVSEKKELIIRFPLIPGITDTIDNQESVIKLMKELGLNKISLLPYHRIAEGKYDKLRLENRMQGLSTHTKDEIESIFRRFKTAGLQVKIGG